MGYTFPEVPGTEALGMTTRPYAHSWSWQLCQSVQTLCLYQATLQCDCLIPGGVVFSPLGHFMTFQPAFYKSLLCTLGQVFLFVTKSVTDGSLLLGSFPFK